MIITWQFHEMLTGDVKFQRKIYWNQNNAVWRSLASSSRISGYFHYWYFPSKPFPVCFNLDSVTLIIRMIRRSRCHISLIALFSCMRGRKTLSRIQFQMNQENGRRRLAAKRWNFTVYVPRRLSVIFSNKCWTYPWTEVELLTIEGYLVLTVT